MSKGYGASWDEFEELQADNAALKARLAEAERLLQRWHKAYHGTITFEPEEFMECVDDDTTTFLHCLRPADSASVCLHQIHNGDTCEICGAKVTPVVQPERCCLDYPRCDCNSPPEPDDDWLCFQRPTQPKVTP